MRHQPKVDFDFDSRPLNRDSLEESDQTARRRRHECEYTYRAEFSLGNCDFSVWNGVPNVMTEQVGGGRRCECLSRVLSLSAVRPPNNPTSQLIARCFIASVSVRIVAAGIFPCTVRLYPLFTQQSTLFFTPLGLPDVPGGNWNHPLLPAVTDIRSTYRLSSSRRVRDLSVPLDNLMSLRPREHSYLLTASWTRLGSA